MFEFHLDRAVSIEQLSDALASVFSVPPDGVLVVPGITGEEEMGGVSLLCTSSMSGGDFPHHVAVYPQESVALPTEASVAQTVCRILVCRCLISDQARNPYSWCLVGADRVEPVYVDTEALDDRNEFVVSRSVPFNS